MNKCRECLWLEVGAVLTSSTISGYYVLLELESEFDVAGWLAGLGAWLQ